MSPAIRVVIPSAGLLPSDLADEAGCRHAAFIPLGGVPLYAHIGSQYRRVFPGCRICLVVPSGAPVADGDPPLRVESCIIDGSNCIAMSVLAGLDDLREGEAVIVHAADTLIKLDSAFGVDAIYTAVCSDLYRWTSVVRLTDGTLAFPQDRQFDAACDVPSSVCVGVFAFTDGLLLKAKLAEALAEPPSGADPLFSAVQRYSHQRYLELRTAGGWSDCGHLDTYYAAKRHHRSLRYFNHLSYNPLTGQITKTSERKEPFRHQVRWYSQIPESLRAFVPRIFEASDGDEPRIRMEMLSVPTLAEVFVSERIPVGAWNGVAQSLRHIGMEFRRFPFRTNLGPEIAREMYVAKTKSRLAEFLARDPVAPFYYVVTEFGRVSVADVADSLEDFVASAGLLDLCELTPIHGDFCFSNILYDTRTRLVKMIDPRGEFGVPGIYGDPCYDLAKLAHSFCGGYDLLLAGRFNLELQPDGRLELTVRTGGYHGKVRRILEATLLGEEPWRRRVEAIQALLFLSMLPLHADSHNRQLALLATGLALFGKSYLKAAGR